jgi:hypothetical protein
VRALLLLVVSLPAKAADDVDPPAILHEEAKTGRLGRDLVVRATITDESGVFDPVLLYRVGADGEFLRLPMQPVEGETDVYEAVVPGDVVSADVQYFIEAFDNNGNGPARFGDEALPIKVSVLKTAEPLPDPEPPPDDGTKTAEGEGEGGGSGLWIGLGVGAGVVLVAAVATAAAIGGFLLLRPPDIPAQVDVVVTAPTPTSGGGS